MGDASSLRGSVIAQVPARVATCCFVRDVTVRVATRPPECLSLFAPAQAATADPSVPAASGNPGLSPLLCLLATLPCPHINAECFQNVSGKSAKSGRGRRRRSFCQTEPRPGPRWASLACFCPPFQARFIVFSPALGPPCEPRRRPGGPGRPDPRRSRAGLAPDPRRTRARRRLTLRQQACNKGMSIRPSEMASSKRARVNYGQFHFFSRIF